MTPPSDAPDDGFDRRAMLAHLGTHVLLPIQEAVATTTAALPGTIAAYCDALEAGQPEPARATAVAAFNEAADAWQRADALLVGPAAMDNRTLRERIYAWPLLSPCDLDRDVASSWADPASYDLAAAPINERSLVAVEYLLFHAATAHSCLSSPTGWDAMGTDLPRARCQLARVLATDVAEHAATLHTAWRADGGNYVGELASAGLAGSSIPSAQEGVNLVSDALFYVDNMVKGMKLAETTGIAFNACGTVETPCEREVELRYADRATFAIRANLAAFREAFTGTTPSADGPAFDDFLRALGHGALADRMTANLDAAIAAAAALPDSFLTALAADYAKVVAVHAALDILDDDLKSQFLTVLALDIPDAVAADND